MRLGRQFRKTAHHFSCFCKLSPHRLRFIRLKIAPRLVYGFEVGDFASGSLFHNTNEERIALKRGEVEVIAKIYRLAIAAASLLSCGIGWWRAPAREHGNQSPRGLHRSIGRCLQQHLHHHAQERRRRPANVRVAGAGSNQKAACVPDDHR